MVRQGQGEAEFPQKQLETAFLHSLRLMDQNREYLQMHLAPAADSRAAQALDDMAVESARLERTFREVMELSARSNRCTSSRWTSANWSARWPGWRRRSRLSAARPSGRTAAA